MFNFIDLFPFFQLMAGLNFAPSFFSSLQSRYFNPVILIFDKYQQKLVNSFDNKIFDVDNDKTITTGLSDLEKKVVEELVAKAKQKSIEFLQTLKMTYLEEFKVQTETINDKVSNIIVEDERRVRFSFLISGIFSISILLFFPISNLYFPNLCNNIFVRYLVYLIIFQFAFQLIYFFKNKNSSYFSTLIIYIISIILIFATYVVYFKYFSKENPICVCNYKDHSWKQVSIILLIFSTLTTFWLYLAKYLYIIIKYKKALKDELDIKYNSFVENLKTLK